MRFETCATAERHAAMTAAGLWQGRTLLDHFDEAVRRTPDKVAVAAFATAEGRTTTCSYRQLDRLSRRTAAAFVAMGIEPGDVVSMQLPNWLEFFVVHLACLRCGAVTNPLMPFLRHRELAFMLGLAETKLIVVPREFRGFEYAPMIDDLRRDLPGLQHCLVVGGDGENSFATKILGRRWEDEVPAAVLEKRRPGADEVIEILYTSGTTGEPKGVMHTSNTLLSGLPAVFRRLGLTAEDVVLMASPLAHQTGFIYGMMLAIALGGKCVLQDAWNPQVAAQLIQDEGVTFTMASTPFLADLTQEAQSGRYDLGTLRCFQSAGAPIPPPLVEAARRHLGAAVVSGWGMTENGLVTCTAPEDPPERSMYTDGNAFESMELRIVDPSGRPLPAGEEGRLQARGAGIFVGYLKRPQLYGVDADGWFETGDVARMDADGYIRICGRSKDIIIRGGENIPVIEVENMLYRHPAVREVAVVAMPDERLGERACAFVVLKPDQHLALADLTAWLQDNRMARQYWPERLEVVTEMPRTPSGKIQKFRLRDTAREFGAMA